MQLQRGAKQRMSVPFERKPSRRYSRRSTFRSARGQATRQVSGDDHFRRYIPAEGPSAAPPDVKYKPIGQLGQRHHEKSRKLPKRDESGSTTGSRGRPESPSVSWSTSIVLLLRIWSKTAIRNIQIIMYCLWRDCKHSPSMQNAPICSLFHSNYYKNTHWSLLTPKYIVNCHYGPSYPHSQTKPDNRFSTNGRFILGQVFWANIHWKWRNMAQIWFLDNEFRQILTCKRSA